MNLVPPVSGVLKPYREMGCLLLSRKCIQVDTAAYALQSIAFDASSHSPLFCLTSSHSFFFLSVPPVCGKLGFIALDLETQKILGGASCHVRWLATRRPPHWRGRV